MRTRAHRRSLYVRAAAVVLALALPLQLRTDAHGAATELPLEQQVGQLIVLSFPGTAPPQYVLDALRERRAAGVILFGGNIASPVQVRVLTRALRITGGQPIIAVDQEGGRVRRIP